MEDQDILSSKSYKRAEANLKNKLKTDILNHVPHYLIPGFNLHNNFSVDNSDLENVIEQYQEYPYHCDLPKPLLPPARLPRIVLSEEDPALELITLKNQVKSDIDRLKKYYVTHQKELEFIRKNDVKWKKNKNALTTKLPRYISDLAELIEKDPDPYFEGVYNWYYTGGSVDCLQLNNKNILLFPFMGELVSAPLVAAENYLWKPLLNQSAKCELDGSLYELKHNLTTDRCMVLGRYKWNCNFYILSEHDNKCNLTEIHKQPSKIPYISGDLNPTNVNHYCLANVERRVTLWDVTKMKHISRYTVSQNTVFDDPWTSIKYQSADTDVLLFVDRCCLHYLDTRAPFDLPVLTMCPKEHLEKCEKLSLDLPSRNNYCRYIGTNHSVLMCDNRSPKQCVQQKWTHQFKQPLIMGCTINREDKEFVVLSSQVNRETTIILNTWTTDETSHSYHFPYTPHDINTTLHESQMQGMSLNSCLRDRFRLSNIGSALIKNNEDIYLFRQNSIGDIYYQCISHEGPLDRYSSINTRSYCILSSWENAASVQTEALVPLAVSNKTNMEHILEVFTNTPELLGIWEISEDVPLPLTTAPHQKVLSWLESADTKAPVLSQEDQENISTPINTQELISVSQEIDITYLDDSNALQDLLPKVKTVRKKSRKNRK
ncbi:uncharacterized protein LOC108623245 isoform X2 [Ceratina calcarata]|uniref:Uncharacterized protein LOC108623245 isoform X2 n=1 Tax=Ceratina calcarata TaxID=156304 RepID=A0AAJ7N4G4_9HYME|nr:uncharacterized protein LOC108623245 isoform X2 [Ceratina calcarata]